MTVHASLMIARALGLILGLILGLTATLHGALEFHVSPDGNDRHLGTAAKPFATVVRAQQQVRSATENSLRQPIRVIIHGGTYYIPLGLQFDARDGGTDEFPVTYTAAAGEEVILVGGEKLSRIEKQQGSLFKADISRAGLPPRDPTGAGASDDELPPPVRTNQLFQDGRRLTIARHPNDGYAFLDRPVDAPDHLAFAARESESQHLGRVTEGDTADLLVNLWPVWNWHNFVFPVKSVDADARQITLDRPRGGLRAGNRYYLLNALPLLDRPGECVLAWSQGHAIFHPLPQDERAAKKAAGWPTFVASTAPALVGIRGTADQPVRHLHFENLAFSISNGSVIEATHAEHCRFERCVVENGYERGFFVHGPARYLSIVDCEIRDNGWHGIEFLGPAPSKEILAAADKIRRTSQDGSYDVHHRHVIENNHIHHCGQVIHSGAGIRIYQSGYNRVIHNEIDHMPRYGICMKGATMPHLRAMVAGIEDQDRFDVLLARNNLIAFNHVHDVNLDSADAGGIESWGPGRDNEIHNNLIHDVGTRDLPLQSGIYLDDSTSFATVSNNIVYNVIGRSGNQCLYAKGVGNKIINNVLVVGLDCEAAIRNKTSQRCTAHTYLQNIVVFENPEAAIFRFDDWTPGRMETCDLNVYHNPMGPLRLMGQAPGGGTYAGWRVAFGKQFDAESLDVDPGFVDLPQRDFRLREDSPAKLLGIEVIDVEAIGRR